MVRDAHRSGIEVQTLVECRPLDRAFFFAHCPATHGEYPAARARARLEDAAVVADFAELVRGRESGQAAAQYEHADIRDTAGKLEARLRRRGEQPKPGHGFVQEGRTAGCGGTGQEMTSRESHLD